MAAGSRHLSELRGHEKRGRPLARTRAVAYYGAVAGGGGSIGLVLGGILTDWVSWRAGLFINVPVGLALIFAAPRYLPETERKSGHFDLAGAAASTIGMTAVVYGMPAAAVRLGAVCESLPLPAISPRLLELTLSKREVA